MPRRKYRDTYRPHAGTTPHRPVTKGEALDDEGQPVRLTCYHSCGATIFVGYRDFDTAHWRHAFYASAESTFRRVTTCPQCLAELSRENVRALFPDQLDPQQFAATQTHAATARTWDTSASGELTTTPNEPDPHPQPVG